MRKIINYITLGIFLFFSVISLIFYLILMKQNLNVPENNLAQLSEITNIHDWLSDNHNFNTTTNFWISYLGFDNFVILSGNALWSIYVVVLLIFLPMSGIIFLLFWSTYLLNFYFRKVRRVELVRRNTFLTIVFLTLLTTTLILFFSGLIIVESFENQEEAKTIFKTWYGDENISKVITIGNKNIVLDAVRLFNVLIAHDGLNNFLISKDIPNIYRNSMVILIFVVPIFIFLTLISGCVVFSSRTVLYEYNLIGKRIKEIKNWINFKNIASKKEIAERYWKNPTLILTMITFLCSVSFPAFFPIGFLKHPYASTFILIFAIALAVASFIPSLLLLLKVMDIKFFPYNRYIFIQIVIFFLAGLFWQIFIWIIWSNKFIYFDYIPIITIFLYIFSSFISLFMFIRK